MTNPERIRDAFVGISQININDEKAIESHKQTIKEVLENDINILNDNQLYYIIADDIKKYSEQQITMDQLLDSMIKKIKRIKCFCFFADCRGLVIVNYDNTFALSYEEGVKHWKELFEQEILDGKLNIPEFHGMLDWLKKGDIISIRSNYKYLDQKMELQNYEVGERFELVYGSNCSSI